MSPSREYPTPGTTSQIDRVLNLKGEGRPIGLLRLLKVSCRDLKEICKRCIGITYRSLISFCGS